MVDLYGKDQGNISLPSKLQSYQIQDTNLEDEEDEIPIINMQTALYNIQIDNLVKKIKRLEFRNNELLDIYKTTDLATKTTNIETSDQIAQLNRQIFADIDKINEYKRQIEAVEKRRIEEKQVHLKKVDFWNDRYVKTHLSLTSEIKALNAKVNTLEDYKNTRIDLRNKLKTGDDSIAIKEEEIKQKLEHIKRKFKIDREKFKDDMSKHLLGLAGTLQMEVADCTVNPVLRLIRENISLKNELIQTMNASLIKKKMNIYMKNADELHLNQIRRGHSDTMQHLITVKIQDCLLKVLKDVHGKLKKHLANFCASSKLTREEYQCLPENSRDAITLCTFRVKNLEILFQREQVKLGLAKYFRNKSKFEVNWYTDMLYDVKYAVTCAFKAIETGGNISEIDDTQLISYLLNIFIQGESQLQLTKPLSLESISTASDAYATGDLGFEPKHINLEANKLSKDNEPSKLNTFEFPVELDDLFKHINRTESEDVELVSTTGSKKDELVEESSEESVQTEGTVKSDEVDNEEREMEERKTIEEDKFYEDENKIPEVVEEEIYPVVQESDSASNEEEIIHKVQETE